MSKLTLEIDTDLLARAEEASHVRGSNLRSELMARITELGEIKSSKQAEAVRRLVELSDANPAFIVGGMPGREERNAR